MPSSSSSQISFSRSLPLLATDGTASASHNPDDAATNRHPPRNPLPVVGPTAAPATAISNIRAKARSSFFQNIFRARKDKSSPLVQLEVYDQDDPEGCAHLEVEILTSRQLKKLIKHVKKKKQGRTQSYYYDHLQSLTVHIHCKVLDLRQLGDLLMSLAALQNLTSLTLVQCPIYLPALNTLLLQKTNFASLSLMSCNLIMEDELQLETCIKCMTRGQPKLVSFHCTDTKVNLRIATPTHVMYTSPRPLIQPSSIDHCLPFLQTHGNLKKLHLDPWFFYDPHLGFNNNNSSNEDITDAFSQLLLPSSRNHLLLEELVLRPILPTTTSTTTTTTTTNNNPWEHNNHNNTDNNNNNDNNNAPMTTTTTVTITSIVKPTRDHWHDFLKDTIPTALKHNTHLQSLRIIMVPSSSSTTSGGMTRDVYQAWLELVQDHNFVLRDLQLVGWDRQRLDHSRHYNYDHNHNQGIDSLIWQTDFYLACNQYGRRHCLWNNEEEEDTEHAQLEALIRAAADHHVPCLYYFLQLNPAICNVI